MQRMTIVLLAAALALPAPAGAQLLSLGVKGGYNQAAMSLSVGGTAKDPGSRSTFHLGPFATLSLSEAFGVEFAALYVGRGFQPNTATGVTAALDLSYLDVPVLATFTLLGPDGLLQPRIYAGPLFSFRMQCTVNPGVADESGFQDCNPDNVGTFDLGLEGGVGLKVGRGRGGLTVDVSYGFGLVDVNRSSADITAYNRNLSLSVGYLFPIM